MPKCNQNVVESGRTFKRRPFNCLPIENGSLFDLSVEYLTYLLKKSYYNYDCIIKLVQEINKDLPAPSYSLYGKLFQEVEVFIDQYSKIVKCVRLSLGKNVGNVKPKDIVFDEFDCKFNDVLQELIIHGIRNTLQHFEERLQDYQSSINPFLKICYDGKDKQWEIKFGNGGFSSTGCLVNEENNFDKEKISFESYKQQSKKAIKVKISLHQILLDLEEITKLLEKNLNKKIKQKGIDFLPAPREFSVFAVPGANIIHVSGI